MKRYAIILIVFIPVTAYSQSDLTVSASATFEDISSVGYYFSIAPMYGTDGMKYMTYPLYGEKRVKSIVGEVSSQISGVTIEWASSYASGEYAYYGYESAQLSANKFLIFGASGGVGQYGYAQVANVNATEVTYATPYTWTTDGGTLYWAWDALVMSPTKVVFVYSSERDDDDKGNELNARMGKAMVVDIGDDDSISFGDYAYLPTTNPTRCDTDGLAAAKVGDSTFITVYQIDGQATQNPRYNVIGAMGVVSGATISYTTYSVCWDNGYTDGQMSLIPLAENYFVHSFLDWNDEGGYSRLLMLDQGSGAIIFYASTQFCSQMADEGLTAAALDTANFILAYHGDGPNWYTPNHAYTRLGYASGTEIVYKDPVEFNIRSYYIGSATAGSVTAVIAYSDNGTGRSNVVVADATSLWDTPTPGATATPTATETPTPTQTPTVTPTATPSPLPAGLALNCTPDIWNATSASRGDGGNRKIPSEIDLSFAEDPPLLKDLANAGVLVQPYSFPLFEEIAHDFIVNGTSLFRDYAYFCKPPIIQGEPYERTKAYRWIGNATLDYVTTDYIYEGTAMFLAPTVKPHWMDFEMRDNGAGIDEIEFRVFYSAEDEIDVAAYDSDWRLKDRAHIVCDGVSDNSTIEQIMASRPDVRRIHLLAGTYNLSSYISVPTDDVTIYGDGDATKLIVRNSLYGIRSDYHSTVVSGLYVQQPTSFKHSAYGVVLTGASGTVENITFEGMERCIYGATDTYVNHCRGRDADQFFFAPRFNGSIIQDCYIEDMEDAIYNAQKIINNVILNTTDWVIRTDPSLVTTLEQPVEIRENYIRGGSYGIYGFHSIGSVTKGIDLEFTDNYCTNLANGGINITHINNAANISRNTFINVGYANTVTMYTAYNPQLEGDYDFGEFYGPQTAVGVRAASPEANIRIQDNKFIRNNVQQEIRALGGQIVIANNSIRDSSGYYGITGGKSGWPIPYEDAYPILDRPQHPLVNGRSKIIDNDIQNINQADYVNDPAFESTQYPPRPVAIGVYDGAVISTTPYYAGAIFSGVHSYRSLYGYGYGTYCPYITNSTYTNFYTSVYGFPIVGRTQWDVQGNRVHIDDVTGETVGIHLFNNVRVWQSDNDYFDGEGVYHTSTPLGWNPPYNENYPQIQFSYLNATVCDNIFSGTGMYESIYVQEYENAQVQGGGWWSTLYFAHPALVNADIFNNMILGDEDDNTWDYIIMPEITKTKTFADQRRRWRIAIATDTIPVDGYPLTIGADPDTGNSANFLGGITVAGGVVVAGVTITGGVAEGANSNGFAYIENDSGGMISAATYEDKVYITSSDGSINVGINPATTVIDLTLAEDEGWGGAADDPPEMVRPALDARYNDGDFELVDIEPYVVPTSDWQTGFGSLDTREIYGFARTADYWSYIGDGTSTSFSIVHSGSNEVIPYAYIVQGATLAAVELAYTYTDSDRIDVEFISAPSEDQYVCALLNAASHEAITGSATQFTVTHGLNTQQLFVSVREDFGEYRYVDARVEYTDSAHFQVEFTDPPGSNSYELAWCQANVGQYLEIPEDDDGDNSYPQGTVPYAKVWVDSTTNVLFIQYDDGSVMYTTLQEAL